MKSATYYSSFIGHKNMQYYVTLKKSMNFPALLVKIKVNQAATM